jgi:hypothetical protein
MYQKELNCVIKNVKCCQGKLEGNDPNGKGVGYVRVCRGSVVPVLRIRRSFIGEWGAGPPTYGA